MERDGMGWDDIRLNVQALALALQRLCIWCTHQSHGVFGWFGIEIVMQACMHGIRST